MLGEYALGSGVKTYADAVDECKGLGKQLAEPRCASANSAIYQEASTNAVSRFWIGIQDISIEGSFVYESSGQTIGYTNWNSNEPNNSGNEDCVEINFLQWNDLPCNIMLSFVCEKTQPGN